MKKFIFLFILISGFTFGQFTVSGNSNEWKTIGKHYAAIELLTKKDSTKAIIKYVDTGAIMGNNLYTPTDRYQFEFSTEPDTLDKIYEIIVKNLKARKIQTITLTFPEGEMYLNFDYSTFGGYYFNFQFDNNSSGLDKNASGAKRNTYALTLERVRKLFNKPKK